MGAITRISTTGKILTGDNSELDYFPPVALNVANIGTVVAINLLAGIPQTITPPSAAKGFGLRMPSNNQVVVTLKGTSADTGIQLDPIYGIPWIAIVSGQSFVLLSTSNVTVYLTAG